MKLETIGSTSFFGYELSEDSMIGRVVFVDRQHYKVMLASGVVSASLKGKLYYELEKEALPTVGDWVDTVRMEKDRCQITHVYPRKNKLSRKVSGIKTEEQLIAANVDDILICMALNEDFNIARMERYLFAFSYVKRPIVVLTKLDLVTDSERQVQEIRKNYPDIVIECVSAVDDRIEKLRAYFAKGRTCVIIGSSGVGKSTIVNKLFHKELHVTQEINDKNGKGRHTTTYRQLQWLGEDAGCIIDTPGMREIAVWNGDDGNASFEDIQQLANRCKFRDCTHTVECGCAVLAAVQMNQITKARVQSYQKLTKELHQIQKKQKQIKSMNNKRKR